MHFILQVPPHPSRMLAKSAIDNAPAGYHVRVEPPTRSIGQSSKFHAMCADIAKQKEFAGKIRSPEQWKMLLVSGHAAATKRGSEMLPGLEGEFVNLRESTAAMGVKRISSLIEYTIAWCVENGIVLHDKRMAA